ncbi:non-ribosomal peptide synthetase [Streptomyces sp. NBC_00525]|uniref:non-ribosomal peptide synthetase n=1 Tax=Streptomyces sp. NBC_00525 TaxID=2903660 RepID=UPI002E80944B|nr:amino acid adenylation domain-containing protein [Streptomyces sp. NBC_00525]WUC96798.1 amino acid adenylation domain-containing protein [Streptomyces sp. NBC_00525]
MPSDATVAPAPATLRLPLSVAQRDIWTAHSLDPTGLKYNVAECRDIRGPIDPELMGAAWRRLTDEADVLRIRRFEDDGEDVWQLIDTDRGDRTLPYIDVSGEADPERAAWDVLDAMIGAPFDLTGEPPVRCALIRLAADRSFYFCGFHHLVTDGAGLGMLLQRLIELYEQAVAGEPWGASPFGRLADVYAEDAAYRCSDEAAADRAWWREHLSGAPERFPSLIRGSGRAAPARGTLPFSRRTVLIPAHEADRLRAVARAERVSWPVLVVALFTVYLHRVTAQDELTVALPVPGRTTKTARSTPSMASNIVPLRLRVGAGETLRDLVRAVSAEVKNGLRHQLTRFEDLRRDAGTLTGGRRMTGPVLNIMAFNADLTVCGHTTVNHNVTSGPVEDLNVTVYDLGASDGFRIDFDTPVDGVDTEAIAAHLDRLAAFLVAAVDAAEPGDRRIAELEVLSEGERELLLGPWAGAVADRDDVSLVARFEEQAARFPDAVALIDGEQSITYAELNATANQWARHLRSRGLGRGDLAGILLERGATFAAALIAVLKTGAGHVLLDPDFPDERLRSAAGEAEISHLVTRTGLAGRLEGRWVTCAEGPEDVAGEDPGNLDVPICGDDLACVMFTSGSTGRPKGIVSSHRNLVSTLVGQTYLPTGPEEVYLQSSPVSWDAFSLEFWGPLLHGARVVLQPGQKPEPALIAELAPKHRVTTLLLSASLFNYLTDEHPETFESVTTAYTVGEAASPAHVHKLLSARPGIRVLNGYGPAEAMIYATTHTIEPSDEPHAVIPIGTPLVNKPLYVLDTALRLCPPGATGELYVSGDGLAHGYLNRADLTATHFVPHPYGPAGSRLYRTGDLAHFDTAGRLHYEGRADHQIKIRGFRIEPAEVETALLTHPQITQAVVTKHHDQLSAYVVATDVSVEEVRRHIVERLPEHLVPAYLTPLDRFPLMPNGKIDKRALPEPVAVASGGRAPRTLLEETLTGLFTSTLDAPGELTIDDDFFHHGGHSIRAARLTNRIAQVLGVRLTIRDVFENPTVARLAEKVGTEKGLPALPPLSAGEAPDRDAAPMSFAQRRLWLLADLEGSSTAYNVPMAVRLAGVLDTDALEAAFNDVLARHAPLRTVYETAEGEPRQRVLPAGEARVVVERREVTADELDAAMADAGRRSFDLRGELPLAVTLFRLDEALHHLVVVMHHIATDGQSSDVFVTDLARAYEARVAGADTSALESLPVRYADYAVWQQRVLGSPDDADSVLTRELDFWRGALAGLPEEHSLNLDRPRPVRASHRGGQVEVSLGDDLFVRVGELARAEGCTPFMVVHAALAAALTRLGAGTDLAIGSPVAGRTDEALRDLVGFFVNTLVLRTDTGGNPTFRQLLERVRTTDLDAFAHQDAPFDLVLDAVNPARSLSRHPLFQVCLTLETGTPVLALDGVRPAALRTFANGSAKFDLEFLLRTDDGQGLSGMVVFAEDVFDQSTVQRMVTVLGKVLRQALADPETRLGEIEVLSGSERELLLGPWAGAVADRDDVSLVARFEEQAARTPQAIALIDGDTHITYAELNATANQWARHLRSRGLGRGDLAGILLERGATFAAALIAVLKTGAGHVLLDPDFPDERLRSAAEEAAISHLVTRAGLADRLSGVWTTCTEGPEDVTHQDTGNLDVPICGDDLACVMFTSGSTGRPKGIVSTHRNLVSTLVGQDYLPTSPEEVYLQSSPISWDAFSLEFWGPLLHGARVVLQPGQKPEPALIADLAPKHRVTTLLLSASLFNYLTDEHPETFDSVTTAYTVGEAASPVHVHKLLTARPGIRVLNGYGPAEAMIYATTHTIEPSEKPHTVIPIGTPLVNKPLYVLDSSLRLCAPGATGELYVSGDGLAHGYLNRADLTATHFVPHPYGPAGSRLYRTGDLAHFDTAGRLHYEGRADHQIKIRGFRIEPAEVETALLTHPQVTQAVVTKHHDQLSAYVVATDVSMDDVRRHITDRLPEHLVPAYLTPLDRFPLMPNGKIDKRALPEPVAAVSSERAPQSQLEEIAVALFSQVLGTEGPVGVEDSFFAHGGHSLLAARLTNHLADALGVRLTIRDVFQHPTPARLAQYIASLKGRPALPALVAGEAGDGSDSPLSFAQRRLWLLAELDGASTAYNVPMAVRLTGTPDVDALAAALNDVAARHAPLRTVFTTVAGEPRQRVQAADRAGIVIERRSSTPERLDDDLDAATRQRFDLTTESPLRATLFDLGDGHPVLFLLFHHIATDGRSAGVFFDDLTRAYAARVSGAETSVLEPLSVQYADYAVWQQKALGSADDADSVLARELAFWQDTLADLPEEHGLTLARPRPAAASHRGGQVEVSLGDDLFVRVGELARTEGCTPFMVLHAALAAALTRLGAGTDLAIGSPVAGRTDEALRDLVGFFVNTLVLRTDTGGNPTFRQLLERVRTTDLDAFAHQDAPFDLVLDALNPTRTLSRHPLFQICLALEAGEAPTLDLGHGGTAEVRGLTNGSAKFDLEFLLRSDDNKRLHGVVVFAEDLFDRETVQRMVTVLGGVLRQVLADPETRLGEIEVLSDTERELLLGPWAGTTATIEDTSLVARFEDQAARTPQAVALIDGNTHITYAELNATANRWAHAMRARGLGRGEVAGVLLERGAVFAAAVIAVTKAGAGYTLLDPDFPDERLRSAAHDAGITLLVTDDVLGQRVAGSGPWTVVSVSGGAPADASDSNPGVPVRGDDVACVMFTSGSTGRPKGILSSHRNLVSTVTAQTYGTFGPGEVFLQCSPVSWDAFSLEFWGALLHGATTVLQPGQKPEPALIAELSQRHGVTMLQLSASLFNYLTDEHPEAFTTVTTAYTGGEAASPTHIHQLQQLSPHTTIANGYGPAESMGFTTTHTIEPSAEPHPTIPIGTPLTNKAAYILDTTLQPVPPGVTGHLYLTGHGLAHGYLNRPDLTATTFIPNPHGTPGTRLYRTGDLAHYDTHGHLHYNGRADHQLKIRGFRIEPAEIETALLTHPNITQATLTVHHDQLSAYVVTDSDTVTAEDARRHLADRLPEHMVPAYVTVLDRLPLTPNGKIDKRALPTPAVTVSSARAPQTPLEEVTVALFSQVLNTEGPVGVDDSFFAHGGHSLLAARLTNHLADALGVRLTIRDVFQHPTPARLAQHIGTLSGRPALPPLTAGTWDGDGDAPASFAQRRLWLLAELDGGSAAYNVPIAVRLTGDVDAELLTAALHDVVARHTPLRTVFSTVDGEPRQHVVPAARAQVPVEHRAVASDELDRAMADAARHVFDLRDELPVRAHLFAVDDGSSVFLLLLHHIATDGRSTAVLFDDLSRAYEARGAGADVSVLEPLPVRYADYAVWQQRVLGSPDDADSVLAQELAFWHKTLEGLPEEHALNPDRPRPARASHRGGQVEVSLGDDLFVRVGELARAEGCTPFMVVHAALAAALTRLGAGTDLAIGSPVAGRTDEALRDLVGFFVNTLVLRTHTDGNPTFRELLNRVRTTDLDAFAHQDAPFDLVLEALNPTRILSRHPLFQICLTLESGGTPELRLGEARVSAVPAVTSGAAKFDLEFLLRTEDGQGLRGTVLFAEDLFDRETVQRMVTVLREVLCQALADPDVRLDHLNVVSDTERELLLGPWAGTTATIEDTSLVARFEDQAARTPQAIALIDGDTHITYAELNATANQWARHLRAHGLGRGDLAGILLERGATFAAALIAVLKTGAGHVLLDPDFPDERLRSAAEEAAISHLVTHAGLANRINGAWTTCTEGPDDLAAHTTDNLGLPIRSQDVACVMFTSGSTGRPKGILSSHRNLVSTISAQTYGTFGPDEVFLQCSPVSWDAFSLEFWGALLHGGTTVLQPGQKPEPALIAELSQRHGVTMLQLSASLFNYLTDEHPEAFTTVTTAYTGGEAASPTHIHQLQQLSPHTTIANGYGPAESMGFTTTHTIEPSAEPHPTIPIGTPLTNKAAYILDTTLQPVPPGVTGHLYLTGHGLAHGYLNRPDLTATTFIPNPHGPAGTRLYRTGDLAHYDTHGHLHYNGRADHQLKIRGFRIEPAEIEAALLTHPNITQATLTTHRRQLSAYVVTGADSATTEEIRRHLVERLPEHMVPTYLTVLDRLPLTPNGKIDRRALPEPAAVVSQGRAPRNPLEETLVGLFARTLGAETALSIDDDFFHHGGHSLLGARLTNHIAVSLDVRLTVRDVFEHPTPARLAAHITALKSAPAAGAKKARPALRRRTETERISS